MSIRKINALASTLTLGLASSALAVGLGSSPAQASNLYEAWNVRSQNGVCDFEPGPNGTDFYGLFFAGPLPTGTYGCTEGATDANPNFLATRLAWGVPQRPDGVQSSVFVGGEGESDLLIDPENMNMSDFVQNNDGGHGNRPIQAPPPFAPRMIGQAQMLTLTGMDLDGVLPDFTLETNRILNIRFFETPNNVGSSTAICPGTGGMTADQFVGGCPDLFVIDSITDVDTGVTQAVIDTDPTDDEIILPFLSFRADSYEYDLILQITGDITGGSEICDGFTDLAAGDQCVGFATDELQLNRFQLNYKIQATELPRGVPEPSSLAMLLASVAGLGWLKKRKQA